MKRFTLAAVLAGVFVAGAAGAHAFTHATVAAPAVGSLLESADWNDWRGGWQRGGPGYGRHGGWHGRGGPGRGDGPFGRMMREADADDDRALTRAEVDAYADDQIAVGDADGDGNLTLEEFQTVWLAMMRSRMVDAFQALDDDGDATVTRAEIDAVIEAMFARMDRNEDGVIDRADRGRGARGDGRQGPRRQMDGDGPRRRMDGQGPRGPGGPQGPRGPNPPAAQ